MSEWQPAILRMIEDELHVAHDRRIREAMDGKRVFVRPTELHGRESDDFRCGGRAFEMKDAAPFDGGTLLCEHYILTD